MNQNYRKLAIIDVDGTLMSGQILNSFIKYLYRNDLVNLEFILRLNLWFILYKIGLIININPIYIYAVRYFKNWKVSDMDQLIEKFVNEVAKSKVFPESYRLLHELKNNGYSIVLLSTAVEPIIKRIALLFNADDYICTKLSIENGLYSGMIDGDIIYGTEKSKYLAKYCQENNYDLVHAVAYADHKSDITMLKSVGKSYIVNPSYYMRKIAKTEGIAIINLN